MLEIRNLVKIYPGPVTALAGVDLDIPAGMFGLLGPNGAGKSTFMKILAGLLEPTSGAVTLDGHDVVREPEWLRARLGYLPQEFGFYPHLSGEKMLMHLLKLKGVEAPGGLKSLCKELLERVNLGFAAKRAVKGYSGGMRQRLGIAGALVHRPPVVILDEPASALDPGGRRDVLELIAGLRGETTVLFSTHVLADVERICDRVGILDHGRLVVEGPLADLLDRYALPVYRIEAEPGQAAAVQRLADRLRSLSWVTGAAVDHGLLTVAVSDPAVAARELLAVVVGEDVAVLSIARARPTLEDVFLTLTGTGEAAA